MRLMLCLVRAGLFRRRPKAVTVRQAPEIKALTAAASAVARLACREGTESRIVVCNTWSKRIVFFLGSNTLFGDKHWIRKHGAAMSLFMIEFPTRFVGIP